MSSSEMNSPMSSAEPRCQRKPNHITVLDDPPLGHGSALREGMVSVGICRHSAAVSEPSYN